MSEAPLPLSASQAGVPAGAGEHVRGGGLDKSGGAIRDMFAQVARRHDLLHHLLSGGLDLLWRRPAAAAAALPPPSRALGLEPFAGTRGPAPPPRRRGPPAAGTELVPP